MSVNVSAVESAVSQILMGLGENTTREGLVETPARYAKFMADWMLREPLKFTTFDSEGMSEMIVQTGIPFASLCEHHMLPFIGHAVVGYLPGSKIVGLSKLARAVKYCSKGLQNQERITLAIADLIQDKLQPKGLGVVLRAEHLCMTIRGVQAPGTHTLTSCLRGEFLTGQARHEFLSFAELKWPK